MARNFLHSTPIQILVGVVSTTIGVALFLVSMPVQVIALIIGIGLLLTGLFMLFTPRDTVEDSTPVLARIAGGLLALLGALIALWPAAGAPMIAFLIGAALIIYGLFIGIRAFRQGANHRISSLMGAATSIILGALTFAWPVLTLVFFRWGVGAWFIFIGVHLIFAPALRFWRGRESSDSGSSRASHKSHTWLRVLGGGVSLALAVGLAFASASIFGGVPLPEPGAFYTAPASVPQAKGQLLRSEPITTGVPNGAEAWKILYTTTHPDGTPAISSGTVIAPAERDGSTLPLLTVAHGTTGIAPKCAPSLSATPFADGAGTSLEEMVTEHGWVAVTSDYIGLGTEGPHPYLIGDAEARNVLDASLAAQMFAEITTTTDTVVWGHSQGGQAALWVGQIAEDYAPELTLKGVAAFAPASDLFGLAEADKSEAAGKTVSAYIASTWNLIYPELGLASHLTPGSKQGVAKISDLCFNGEDVIAALLRGTQITNQVFPDSVLAGTFGDMLKANEPIGPFPAPVMVAQGLADPLVKPNMQYDWVSSRCKAGDEIDYRTFPGLSHNSLVAADSPLTPEIVQWSLDRWAGKTPTPNCDSLPK